jgi:hypothetical protein
LRILALPWLGPNLAFLSLIAGLLLVYWELCRPGTVLPGAIGAAIVLVAVARCAPMPGAAWIGLGFAILLASAWFRWLGLIGIILVSWGASRMGVRWWLAVPLSVLLGIATVYLGWAALQGFIEKRRLD